MEALAQASRFRGEFYACLSARRDELFELTDAVLCVDGPVVSPVDLTMVPEHRRGHGALYGALNRGGIDIERLRTLLAGLPLPRFEDRSLVLAVDVSPWLRSDAPCSADRLFCHVYGRAKSASQFIPGWPYSFVAVLEPGATSWTGIASRTHSPLRIRHVRRIPTRPVRAVGRVPEPMREAIALRHARVGRNGHRRARLEQQGLLILEWRRNPELPRGPALMHPPRRDHPTRDPVRPEPSS
jgi:hypothetical protein